MNCLHSQEYDANVLLLNFIPKTITDEQGLVDNRVNTVFQDKNAFIWIGTFNGLSRFDGHEFVNFSREAAEPDVIGFGDVREIVQTPDNNLWLRSDWNNSFGVNAFDPDNNIFKHYKNLPSNPNSLSSNNVFKIFVDSKGNLWVATKNGLNLYNKTDDNFIVYKHNPKDTNSLCSNIIYDITEDRAGNIWIATSNGFDRFNILERKFKHYLQKFEFTNYPNNRSIYKILADKEYNVFLASQAAIVMYNTKTKTATRYLLDPENKKRYNDIGALQLHNDKFNNIWISSPEGFYKFHPSMQTNKSKLYLRQYKVNLKNKISTKLMNEDKQGNLWMSSLEELHYYDRFKDKLVTYKINNNVLLNLYLVDSSGNIWAGPQDPEKGLNLFLKLNNNIEPFLSSDNKVLKIENLSLMVEDKSKNLWIGTENYGVYYLDFKEKKIEHILFNENKANPLSHNNVNSILIENNNSIWIGTRCGLNNYNPVTRRITRYFFSKKDTTSLANDFVCHIGKDSQGKIWIGTWGGGLNLYDPKNNSFVRYPDPSYDKSIEYDCIKKLCIDHNNTIWLANNKCLRSFNPLTGVWKYYLHSDKSGSLSDNRILDLLEDSEKKLWIATHNGLNLYCNNNSGEYFKTYSTENGLLSSNISIIGEDKQRNLWLKSYKGITKFNTATNKVVNFVSENDIVLEALNTVPPIVKSNGDFICASTKGFFIINPSKYNPEFVLQKPYITNLLIFNTPIYKGEKGSPLKENINCTNKIVLTYKQNNFGFEYTTVDYKNPKSTRFAHMLEGYDKNWVFSNYKRRYVSYSNLPAGKYVFKIKTIAPSGISSGIKTILITILSPFWKTWWAYIIYFFCLSLVFYFWRAYIYSRAELKNKLNFAKIQQEKLEEINQMKTRFFTNISHELRTPLTLIIGPIEDAMKNDVKTFSEKQIEIIHRNAKKLFNLINQLLDFQKSKNENLKFNPEYSDIVFFIRNICIVFGDFAKQHNFEYQFFTKQEPIFLCFDKDLLERVIYNLISNAFKFTPDGGFISVSIRLFADDSLPHKYIDIEIKDTGIGISKENIQKIFTLFFQIKEGEPLRSSLEQIGSGIGLSFSKELVELHKGQIIVESEIGRGSSFIVRIPLLDLKVIPSRNSYMDSSLSEKNTFPFNHGFEGTNDPNSFEAKNDQSDDIPILLLVDDNKDMRIYLRDIFSKSYRIYEGANGIEGYSIALKVLPDIIISDIIMPEMDGIELCKKIKSNLITAHIPIMLLTALVEPKNEIEGFGSGADDYIAKPFVSELIKIRVNNLVEIRRKLRDLFFQNPNIQTEPIMENKLDQAFLSNLNNYIEEHFADADLSVESLFENLAPNMSKITFRRKVKSITGRSPLEYIHFLRLRKSIKLISSNQYTINQVAYQCGFQTPAYFSICFRQQFGVNPSEYIATLNRKEV